MSVLPEENFTLPLRLPKVEVCMGVREGVVALMTRLLSLGERESDCGREGKEGGEERREESIWRVYGEER